MASNLPLPIPPRTPTPPAEPEFDDQDASQHGIAKVTFDPNALSPLIENFPGRFSTLTPSTTMPGSPLSPTSPQSFYTAGSLDSAGSYQSPKVDPAPFNFRSTTLAKSPVSKSVRQSHGSPL